MEIEISVTQIIHGLEYSGQITGLSEGTSYHLLLSVPIEQLDEQKTPDNKQDVMSFAKRLFKFSITKSDNSVEVTDELFEFLMGTIAPLVIDFYNNPQTQDYAQDYGLLASAIRDKEKSFLGKSGASVSIGMSYPIEVPNVIIPESLR